MQGTAKQIKWAEQIKKTFASDINLAVKAFDAPISQTQDGTPNNIMFREAQAKIAAIKDIDDAAWWIDNGKECHDFEAAGQILLQISNAVCLAHPVAKVKALIAIAKSI